MRERWTLLKSNGLLSASECYRDRTYYSFRATQMGVVTASEFDTTAKSKIREYPTVRVELY